MLIVAERVRQPARPTRRCERCSRRASACSSTCSNGTCRCSKAGYELDQFDDEHALYLDPRRRPTAPSRLGPAAADDAAAHPRHLFPRTSAQGSPARARHLRDHPLLPRPPPDGAERRRPRNRLVCASPTMRSASGIAPIRASPRSAGSSRSSPSAGLPAARAPAGSSTARCSARCGSTSRPTRRRCSPGTASTGRARCARPTRAKRPDAGRLDHEHEPNLHPEIEPLDRAAARRRLLRHPRPAAADDRGARRATWRTISSARPSARAASTASGPSGSAGCSPAPAMRKPLVRHPLVIGIVERVLAPFCDTHPAQPHPGDRDPSRRARRSCRTATRTCGAGRSARSNIWST